VRLAELLAIPVGLFVVKQLTERTQDEPNAKKIVTEPKPTSRATPAVPIIPSFTKKELEEQKAFIAKPLTEGALERARKGFGL